MNEKSGLPPTAPETGNYGAPPPPYSPMDPGNKPADSMYPPIGLQTPVESQPIQHQPFQQQPQIIQHVIQVPAPQLTAVGPESVRMLCPHCQADMNTTVVKDPSIAAYVSAAVIFILGCVCGCCLIPFCMDSCKTSEHRCANCKKFVGKYSRY